MNSYSDMLSISLKAFQYFPIDGQGNLFTKLKLSKKFDMIIDMLNCFNTLPSSAQAQTTAG